MLPSHYLRKPSETISEQFERSYYKLDESLHFVRKNPECGLPTCNLIGLLDYIDGELKELVPVLISIEGNDRGRLRDIADTMNINGFRSTQTIVRL